MKNIKVAFLIALIIIGSGCKKWLDVNTDPASPQTSRAEYFLGPMLAMTAICTTQDYLGVQFKYTQNIMAQGNNDVYERHGFIEGATGGNLWRLVYIHYGHNLEEMIKQAESKEAYTMIAIGYALKAYGYQMLTDSHGPIILNDALKDQLQFTYQDQPEVYAKVREWCQLALENFNKVDAGTQIPVLKNVDTMFGTTIPSDNSTTIYKQRWRKFIYAILATQYSHLTSKPDFTSGKIYADSVIKYVDLSFGGTTLNSSEDPTINFDNLTAFSSSSNGNYGSSNPLSGIANIIGATNGRVGQPIVNYLTGGSRAGVAVTNPTITTATSKDPRLTRMINPMVTTATATNGVYRGVVATDGDTPTAKTIPSVFGSANAPFPGKYLYAMTNVDKARYPLYSYAQLQFAKAEAQWEKGNTGLAFTAYINGIRGHMDFVNTYGRSTPVPGPAAISATEITTYLANPAEVAQNAGDLTLADIMGQKYIAQWGWAGQEQWCDFRKRHYDPTLFKFWRPLDSGDFFTTKAGIGQYVYRIRPLTSSEYQFNISELDKWGARLPTYVYEETWFSTNVN